jgi:hypothetical protein
MEPAEGRGMGNFPFFGTTFLVAIWLALPACEHTESSSALSEDNGSTGGTSFGGASSMGGASGALPEDEEATGGTAFADGSSTGSGSTVDSSKIGNSCISMICIPQATLWADLPAAINDPHAGEFQVCHNTECYKGVFAGTVSQYNTLNFVEPDASNGGLSVDLSFHSTANNTAVQLTWAYGSSPGADFKNGDRYRIGFLDAATSAELSILDTTVDYDLRDLGCAGSCLQNYTDQRSSDD